MAGAGRARCFAGVGARPRFGRRGSRGVAGLAFSRQATALRVTGNNAIGSTSQWSRVDLGRYTYRAPRKSARRAKKRVMLNYIWLGLILLAVVIGGCTDHLKDVADKSFENAEFAVMKTALPLVGIMALWLGMMRLAERAGLVALFARGLRPILRWLFPEVPPDHPAMGSMVLNIAAGILGLGNAATPLGLRAMKDLESLNPHPGTATNAMCTFLAINTSSVQLIPATAVGILAAAGSANPTAIIGTALAATTCAAAAAIIAVKALERLPVFAVPAVAAINAGREPEPDDQPPAPPPLRWWGGTLLAVLGASFIGWFVL